MNAAYENARAKYARQCERHDLSDEDLGSLAVIYAGIMEANIPGRSARRFSDWLDGLDEEDVHRFLYKDPEVTRA